MPGQRHRGQRVGVASPLPSVKSAPPSGDPQPRERRPDRLRAPGEVAGCPSRERDLAGQRLGEVVVAVGQHPLDQRGQRCRTDATASWYRPAPRPGAGSAGAR